MGEIDRSLIIQLNDTILHALKKMDLIRRKTLLVFNKEQFVSILTIGDIQRSIIKNISLTEIVKFAIDLNSKVYCSVTDSVEFIKEKILKIRAEIMPVLDENNNLVGMYAWSDFFPSDNIMGERKKIDLPVVIMAGGKGTRLKPLTNVIPKPLVPIGDKTILELIMDQFEGIGCRKFYLSVNYKSDIMRFYLNNLQHPYEIEFIQEKMPMGTIGSVSLLRGKISTPFFVSNCDCINDQDYRDVYDYHVSNHNDMTVVTMVKSLRIPYGVIETGEDGLMLNIKEKPEHTYLVNSGVYILNPELLNEIPEGRFFHITHLMEKIKARGGRVGCFPVSELSWHDIGEWPEYLKLINVI